MSTHMRAATNQRIGIWIDDEKAVIVTASADRVTINTLESWGGEREGRRLDRYYDEIITQLGYPQALLIFGPGEAKLQFNARLSRFKALRESVVGLETADTLTDPQIVAKVKEHYGIRREALLSVVS